MSESPSHLTEIENTKDNGPLTAQPNTEQNSDPELVNEEGLDNKAIARKYWDMIGFHRVASFTFYTYVLVIGQIAIGAITIGVVLPLLMPYPEIEGYKAMAASVLGFWFSLMDFNMGGGSISDGLKRFVGQYANINPRRAMNYIQFYIWFQMFTGLFQVTGILIVCFYFLINTELNYLIWFLIAESLIQYPGMLMIMEGCLSSFQRGDKLAWLQWLQETVFQFSVNVGLMAFGKWWGSLNPAIGEMVGITIFYILSQFLDDWINLVVGGVMLNKILKRNGVPEGVKLMFYPRFDKIVVKECLSFTGKQWVGNQIKGFFSYIIGLFILISTPNLATWTGLLLIPRTFARLVSMQGAMMDHSAAPISEAFNNGKKNLAQYYIHDVLKYFTFLTFMFATILLTLGPRLISSLVNIIPGLENYQGAIILIPFVVFIEFFTPLRRLWPKLFYACNQPMQPIYIEYIIMLPSYGIQFLFIWLCIDVRMFPIWALILFPPFVTDLIRMSIGLVWFNKSVLKIDLKKIAWQVIIAPLLTALLFYGIMTILNYTIWVAFDFVFVALLGDIGYIISALVISMLVLFIVPSMIYAPICALFGGWDKYTLEEFRKTALVSGPSRAIIMLIYKITAKMCAKSPLMNKFPLADYDIVKKEIAELTVMKQQNLQKN
jgi:hypothetical protein